MQLFERYIGIDYSGAKTPSDGLPGLRAYRAVGQGEPEEVRPMKGPKVHWCRRDLAMWLADELQTAARTLVGIDHGFSFPLAYFKKHGLPTRWDAFLGDFSAHWPTGEDHVYVDFVRDGVCGKGHLRTGKSTWRRLVETRTRAKSVFHFDCQGSVAKSTHAGLPWLRYLRTQLGTRAHFWPFDGWEPGAGQHMIAEVYPALYRAAFPPKPGTLDQQDAYAACRWMRDTDRAGMLDRFLKPVLSTDDERTALLEGWILGVG